MTRVWHIEALPLRHGGEEQSSPSTFLPTRGNWVGRVYCLRAVPWIFPALPSPCPPVPGILSKVHPLNCCASGQALTGTQVTPLDALNPKQPPEEGVMNLFLFPASFLPHQGREGQGRASA